MGVGTLRTSAAKDLSEADGCFVAYAAHELRGEITLQLALAEVTLADSNADTAALREMGERVVAGRERQERLLEALLNLARSESGVCGGSPSTSPRPPPKSCEPTIITDSRAPRRLSPPEQAATRSWSSASSRTWSPTPSRHNLPGGRIDVATCTAAGRAIFTIANSGPVIPTGELTRLFQPFQRLSPHPGPSADGVGLGLPIVQAIANAHDATVTAQPRTGGGLRIDIDFPAETWAKPLVA